MGAIITSREYDIHYYEIDYNKKILITSLINYFSDIAIKQSEDLGVGIDYLMENNVAWVLYKWDINIKKYPMYNETITVRTWPFSFRKFYAYRQYDVLDRNGEILATANSIWFFLDTEKRRPKKINEDMHKAFQVAEVQNNEIEIDKIPSITEVTSEKMFNIRYSDIDTNRHVNNTKYVAWCIETVPMDVVLNYSLMKLKVTYEKEITYGKNVKVYTQVIRQEEKIICIHKVDNMENKQLTVAETVWIPK